MAINSDNLISAAHGVVKGQRVIRVDGIYFPVGIGGNFIPQGASGSGGIDLYKCVSVDSATQTWSGYRAMEKDGEFVFSDTLTSGLSYAGGLNVKPGKVYSSDGKIRSNKAYNHCQCIFPFNMNYEDMRGNCKIQLLKDGYQPNGQTYCDSSQRHWGAGSLKFNAKSTPDSSIHIKNLPSMSTFTVEFWQFRNKTPETANYGAERLPGYLSNKPSDSSVKASEILHGTDAKYVGLPVGRWFHHAFVKYAGGNVVREFVDGVAYDTLTFRYNLGGANQTVVFSTMPLMYNPDTHDYSVEGGDGYYMVLNGIMSDFIADLSIWDFPKYEYDENFTPPAEPYKIVWEDTPTITLSGAGIEEVNGTYELITPEAAGKSRVWAKPMSPYLIEYDDEYWAWVILNGEDRCYYGTEEEENPWDGEWYDATDDETGGDAPTFTVNE